MSSDERLRALYRRAVTAASTAEGSHPDEAAWESLACEEASAEERARLLEHLVVCAICAETYRVVLALRAEARQFDPGAPTPAPPARGEWPFAVGRAAAARPRYRLLALAAGVALVAVLTAVFWRAWSQSPTDPEVRSSSTASAPTAPPLRTHAAFRLDKAPVVLSSALVLTPRGAADDRQRLRDELGAALVPYRADNFPEAARRLEPLAREFPNDVEPSLYAGVALLLTGRATEAIPYLERARAKASPEFEEELDWRLALAYVHADRPQAAGPLLSRVCAGRGPYRTRACVALEVLSSTK